MIYSPTKPNKPSAERIEASRKLDINLGSGGIIPTGWKMLKGSAVHGTG